MCMINCCFLWVLDTASVLNPSCDDSHLTCSIRTRQQDRTFFDTAWAMGVSTKKYIWGVWGISWHIPRLECIIYTNFKSLFEPIGFVVLYPIFGQTHITQILPSIYWKKGRTGNIIQIHPHSSRPYSWHFFTFLASQNRFWGSLALQSSTCRAPASTGCGWGDGGDCPVAPVEAVGHSLRLERKCVRHSCLKFQHVSAK